MKKILGLVLSLFLANAVYAEGWDADSIGAGRLVTYNFATGDSTGFSVPLEHDCAAMITSFEAGTAGTASVVSCPTTANTTDCTSVSALAADAIGTLVYPGKRFIRVNKTAIPTGGTTAIVFIHCAEQP